MLDSQDPFAMLGVERRFDLDLKVLEKTHRELSRALHPDKFAQAWNLGPSDHREYSVREVLQLLGEQWTPPAIDYLDNPLPEARALALDSSKARHRLGWQSPWETKRVIAETAAWYRNYYDNPDSARQFTLAQINALRTELAATP